MCDDLEGRKTEGLSTGLSDRVDKLLCLVLGPSDQDAVSSKWALLH